MIIRFNIPVIEKARKFGNFACISTKFVEALKVDFLCQKNMAEGFDEEQKSRNDYELLNMKSGLYLIHLLYIDCDQELLSNEHQGYA